MAVFCTQCGTELPESARFCSQCGAATGPWTRTMPGRPLIRPRVGRQIAGVCVGLARAYGWDLPMVRIFAVVGFFLSGGFVGVAYLACWIGIPEEPLAQL